MQAKISRPFLKYHTISTNEYLCVRGKKHQQTTKNITNAYDDIKRWTIILSNSSVLYITYNNILRPRKHTYIRVHSLTAEIIFTRLYRLHTPPASVPTHLTQDTIVLHPYCQEYLCTRAMTDTRVGLEGGTERESSDVLFSVICRRAYQSVKHFLSVSREIITCHSARDNNGSVAVAGRSDANRPSTGTKKHCVVFKVVFLSTPVWIKSLF